MILIMVALFLGLQQIILIIVIWQLKSEKLKESTNRCSSSCFTYRQISFHEIQRCSDGASCCCVVYILLHSQFDALWHEDNAPL